MTPNKILIPWQGDIIFQDDKITWQEPVINVDKKGPY